MILHIQCIAVNYKVVLDLTPIEDALHPNASLSHPPMEVDIGSDTCEVKLDISEVEGYLQMLSDSHRITQEQFNQISAEFEACFAKGNASAGAPCADKELDARAAKNTGYEKDKPNSTYKRRAPEGLCEPPASCLTTNSFFSKPEEAPVTKSSKLTLLPFIEKIRRTPDSSERQRSSFSFQCSDESMLSFDMQHDPDKNYPEGSSAERVKQGYDVGCSTPKYAIKILKKGLVLADAIQRVMRNVICLRLLGLKGEFFFRNAKLYVLTDWIAGKTLLDIIYNPKYTKYKRMYLETFDLKARVQLALGLIKQVVTLHNNGIVHGDIKPRNIIISTILPGKINLIDFDGAGYIGGTSEHTMFTEKYVNPKVYFQIKQGKYNLDINIDTHALGMTLASLFPDLFMVIISTYSHVGIPYQEICRPIKRDTTSELNKVQAALWQFISELTEHKNSHPMAYFYNKLCKLYIDNFEEALPEDLAPARIPQGNPMYGQFEFDKISTQVEALQTEIEEKNRSNEASSQLKM